MLPQRRALPVVRAAPRGRGAPRARRTGASRERKGPCSLGALGREGNSFCSRLPLPSVLTSALRFCGLIQALVKSPDSGAPAEEMEGAGEVLEVSGRVLGA